MDIVSSFPHAWQCECGQSLQATLPERGFVIRCDGCGREHGPFELADRPPRSDSAGDIAIRETLMLDDQSGADVLSRFIRVGDSAKPWTWTEHSAAVTLALVEELTRRWSFQHSSPSPQGIRLGDERRPLPIQNFPLLQGFLNLMERVDEAPQPLRETPTFCQLCETILEFPDHTHSFLGEPLSRRLLVSSLRLRPTTLKLEWLLNARHEFCDDLPAFHETMQWLITDSAVPEAVSRRAQEHLQFEREWEQNRANREHDDERSTAIARRVILVLFGIAIGFIISRVMLTVPRESARELGVDRLASGVLVAFFLGFIPFLISTIRPVPVLPTPQESEETRSAILNGLILWIAIGVTGSLIALIQFVWLVSFGNTLPALIDPAVGVATGLLGTYAIVLTGHSWNRWRDRPKE